MFILLQIGQALSSVKHIDLSHLSSNHMHLHLIMSLI